MCPEQAGIHKHKLEPHKNRLESTSVPAASDPVAADGPAKASVLLQGSKPVALARESHKLGSCGPCLLRCCLAPGR